MKFLLIFILLIIKNVKYFFFAFLKKKMYEENNKDLKKINGKFFFEQTYLDFLNIKKKIDFYIFANDKEQIEEFNQLIEEIIKFEIFFQEKKLQNKKKK